MKGSRTRQCHGARSILQSLQPVKDVDNQRDDGETARGQLGQTYPMLIGENNAINIAKLYGNNFGALPYTVIIDRQGTIQLVQRGELTREMAEGTIRRLL